MPWEDEEERCPNCDEVPSIWEGCTDCCSAYCENCIDPDEHLCSAVQRRDRVEGK